MCGNYQIGLGEVNSYNLEDCDEIFTRTGIDGAEPIFSLFGSDYFFGEVLEGHWIKVQPATFVGNPTILLDASGAVELTGKSDGAGTYRAQWMVSKNQIYFHKDETVVDVHLKLPSHSAANAFMISFILCLKKYDDPTGTNLYSARDYIRVDLWTDANNYKYYIYKKIDNSSTTLANAITVTNAEGTFRLKFQEALTGHTHIYFHDGAGAIVEADDEVTDSPFTLGLNFDHGYPHIAQQSSEATNRTVSSEKIQVTYPDWLIRHDLLNADVNKGDCKVYDGDPDGSGVRVYDEDHVFSGDCYIQNGLTRLHVDEATIKGLKLYGYVGAAWVQPMDSFQDYLTNDVKVLSYPFLKKIHSLSPDQIVVDVRLEDSATPNSDYYVDWRITLNRGSLGINFKYLEVYPKQNTRVYAQNSTTIRFGYVGDAETHGIGDDDLTLNARNTDMKDNIIVVFDPDQEDALFILCATHKPTAYNATDDGGNIFFVENDDSDEADLKFFAGIIPFTLINYLFAEAEDETLGGGATIQDPDALASGLKSVLMNAENEYVDWDITAGTHLPAGRYIVLFRVKDTTHVASDVQLYVYNSTDGEYRNQEGWAQYRTVTASYLFYQLIFDITDEDVSGTDNFVIRIRKQTVDANSIYCDYFLIVPIGNGKDWPQDLSHGLLRSYKQFKDVSVR